MRPKDKVRAVGSSYPPVVITEIGWAYLIGKSPGEVCLSYAVEKAKRSALTGCCVNVMLPDSIIVDWSPAFVDFGVYPNVLARADGASCLDGDCLAFVDGSWSVSNGDTEEGV